ncbi:MAG: hypothetical protein KAR25_07680 [Methanosarcinales archaeon]|nr:hypothetical protein [Methanosarcinales archaeon]
MDGDVYAAGSRLYRWHECGDPVVPDQDWDDGNPIPLDVTGAVEIVSVVMAMWIRCSSGTPRSRQVSTIS